VRGAAALSRSLTAGRSHDVARERQAADLAGACDKRASFIDQVSAQSGKKIAAADDNELIDEALWVRDRSLFEAGAA
jgi:hypothetical protein